MLVVADPERIAELAEPLADPIGDGRVELDVVVSSGGDDTLDLFAARRPGIVIVTASLDAGDSGSLIEALRGAGGNPAIVLVGDAEGPMRNAIDAAELRPDRFVGRPLSPKGLRFAISSLLETVAPRGTLPGVMAPVMVEPARRVDDRSADEDADVERSIEAHAPSGPRAHRAAMRARWAALADSIVDEAPEPPEPGADDGDEAEPLPPPMIVAMAPVASWRPGTTSELADEPAAPAREPTLILNEAAPLPPTPSAPPPPPTPEVEATAGSDASEHWSEPVPLAELVDASRDSARELSDDDLGLDDFDDDLVIGDEPSTRPAGRIEILEPPSSLPDGRDFARQLRAKMSMMAQRLFQGGDAPSPPAGEMGPRHDHHTEIDLASLGDEAPLGDRGVTEIESRGNAVRDLRDSSAQVTNGTGSSSWDEHVRERGLPDAGDVVRGVSDAAMLLAKMFASAATGRIIFRQGNVEKVVYLDQGRPVFAASNERLDRMGELLVREGKITASQYERCQNVVAESGRRMGEILVDLGYLKRRELLPAVRRHVEDILYSLFGWDRGTYQLALDATPSAERIRLSRHPASLILEGVRRKLDRTTLERLVGPPSTVIEVPDRERLGGVLNLGDLAAEERASLAAFDGQADLLGVARTAGVDLADVLPLAWGLCVLGLANARRTDTEVPDESSALVGETDLAIDRERVRARWALVTDADYFALLGVRRDATTFEIRRAYQGARRDFAADCFPQDLRRELAQELDDIANVLDEAFRVLRDDRLRLTYLSNLIE